jgi:hypothetical protein
VETERRGTAEATEAATEEKVEMIGTITDVEAEAVMKGDGEMTTVQVDVMTIVMVNVTTVRTLDVMIIVIRMVIAIALQDMTMIASADLALVVEKKKTGIGNMGELLIDQVAMIAGVGVGVLRAADTAGLSAVRSGGTGSAGTELIIVLMMRKTIVEAPEV